MTCVIAFAMNVLHYGDNLPLLRELPAESVDLVYLDPPFNSNRAYNVLFKNARGEKSRAQIQAFDDTWRWGPDAEAAFQDLMSGGAPARVAATIGAIRNILPDRSDLLAYLVMMAPRLIELHRVMKATSTLYLHCDATASHYLKVILDAILGGKNFRNEIIWKRSNPKSHITANFPACTDTILRYTKSDDYTFHQPYAEHDPEYVRSAYKHSDAGGVYRLLPLLNPNDDRPNLEYEFLGVTRVWRWTRERMQKAYDDGLIVQVKPGAVPQYKKYLDDSKGRTVTNCWTDIPQASGHESLGYPTQKPLALLERIIAASSNEGDVVLDPFCGCGTAVDAAERLKRRWIGIDISYLAVDLIMKRLRSAHGRKLKAINLHGVPRDLEGAKALFARNPFEFERWAEQFGGVRPNMPTPFTPYVRARHYGGKQLAMPGGGKPARARRSSG